MARARMDSCPPPVDRLPSVRRLLRPGFAVPILLALAGVALIIVGQLDLDQPGIGPSLPPIPEPTQSGIAEVTASPSGAGSAGVSASPSASPKPSPTPNPKWVAVQMQIPSVGINIRVQKATKKADCDFPPEFPPSAWILCGGQEPGRGTNSYIFAHAQVGMFLPLWNVQLGAEVRVLMSDGKVLVYRVTEVHPNVSCPDTREKPMSYWTTPPLALKYAPGDCRQGAFWSAPANHERLTLQTSQGYNRNWGEFIVVAEPRA
ncbi:MAG: sortase [Chloroflexi bacterium]|nr:MAG: sortase [Chloroflexota bacterium]